MKKLLLIATLLICGVATANSQIVYQPFIPKRSSEPSIIIMPDYSRTPTYHSVPSITKTKEELLNIQSYSIATGQVFEAKVKGTSYSDGSVYHRLMGVKTREGWMSLEYDVDVISAMLSDRNTPKEKKEFLLHLSEYATHLVSIGDDILLLGLKQHIQSNSSAGNQNYYTPQTNSPNRISTNTSSTNQRTIQNNATYSGSYKYRTTIDHTVEVSLRASANVNSREIYRCPRNATVYVLEILQGPYYKVYVNGHTGYLSKGYLKDR